MASLDRDDLPPPYAPPYAPRDDNKEPCDDVVFKIRHKDVCTQYNIRPPEREPNTRSKGSLKRPQLETWREYESLFGWFVQMCDPDSVVECMSRDCRGIAVWGVYCSDHCRSATGVSYGKNRNNAFKDHFKWHPALKHAF
jgi:hypothetical protein